MRTLLVCLALALLAAAPAAARAAAPVGTGAAACSKKVTGLKLPASQGTVTLRVTRAAGLTCTAVVPFARRWAACAFDPVNDGGCGGTGRYKCSRPTIRAGAGKGPTQSRSGGQSCAAGKRSFTLSWTQRRDNPAYSPPLETCAIDPALNVSGTTVTSLRAGGMSCAEATTVMRAFNECRLANGATGRCVKLVDGFACQESRLNAGPQYESTGRCRDGADLLRFVYTQTI